MQRGNLSHGLEDELRDLVVRGQLVAGDRINEVHLAKQLEVSRTPLREALTRLAGEQFLEAQPRIGFFVRALSATEVEQLYPIRAKLDPWALELAGLPDRKTIEGLDALNEELRGSDPDRAIALDDEWHLALVAHCPNKMVIELIRHMMWRTRRYEYAYFRATEGVSTAYAEHRKLLAALRKKDLRAACKRLEVNMTSAMPALVAWLGSQR